MQNDGVERMTELRMASTDGDRYFQPVAHTLFFGQLHFSAEDKRHFLVVRMPRTSAPSNRDHHLQEAAVRGQ